MGALFFDGMVNSLWLFGSLLKGSAQRKAGKWVGLSLIDLRARRLSSHHKKMEVELGILLCSLLSKVDLFGQMVWPLWGRRAPRISTSFSALSIYRSLPGLRSC